MKFFLCYIYIYKLQSLQTKNIGYICKSKFLYNLYIILKI